MNKIFRHTVCFAAMLPALLPTPGFAQQPENEKTEAVVPPRAKYLLLDNRLITGTDNARVTLGTVKKHPANPLFGQESPWETDISHMYPNVVYDRQEHIYKIWYYTRILDWKRDVAPGSLAPKLEGQGNCATLHATSKDGIRWEKPRLDVYRYKGEPTNIVFWRDHGTGVFKDPRDPNPERRYKMFCTGRAPGGRVHVAFSPDGIQWTELIDTKISTAAEYQPAIATTIRNGCGVSTNCCASNFVEPAPEVRFTAPRFEAWIDADRVKLEAETQGQDGRAIRKYCWFVDNRLVAETDKPVFEWDTSREWPGRHMLTVHAIDEDWNRAASQIPVRFIRKN